MEKTFNSINDIAKYWKSQLDANSTSVNDYYREIYENGKLIGSAISYNAYKSNIANCLGMYSVKSFGISNLVLTYQPDDGSIYCSLCIFWNGKFWVIYPGEDNCEFNLFLYAKTYTINQLAKFVGELAKKSFDIFKPYGDGCRALSAVEIVSGNWGIKDYPFSGIPTPAEDLRNIVKQFAPVKSAA